MRRKKLGLLFAMLALCAPMVGAIAVGSPYAPVIGPYREIEELWKIEDERQESEEPLVSLTSGAPIGTQDAPASVTVSQRGEPGENGYAVSVGDWLLTRKSAEDEAGDAGNGGIPL